MSKKMRLLCVDVGNTSTSFAVFERNRIIKKINIPTIELRSSAIKRNLGKIKINNAVISSVVPSRNKILEENLKFLSGKQPYILGKNLTVPIKNRYHKPRQVGQDRLVNAYAGIKLFGAPLIVVDFGTAITFDIVSKNKEYLGGLILPGLNMSLEALAEKTALLPKIKLSYPHPRNIIGKDTRNSILSGVVYGFSALTDSLIKNLKKINKGSRVIGTGGNINLIAKYCHSFDRIDQDLTLKGLNFIYGDTLKRGGTVSLKKEWIK